MKHSVGKYNKQHGFTLVELLAAVAIVGIIAAIAFSSSTRQASKAGRANAKALLIEIRGKEEQFFINNKSYTADLKALRYVANTGDDFFVDSKGDASSSTKGAYQITLSNVDVYTITATAVNNQAKAETDCKVMTLKESGAKSPASCW